MANLTEEKCQKNGMKYGVVCCPCRSTFVAYLLKNPLYVYNYLDYIYIFNPILTKVSIPFCHIENRYKKWGL